MGSIPTHSFVRRLYENPDEYTLPADAPTPIGQGTDVVDYDLFNNPAPAHTRNYMLGLDVIDWKLTDGTERSHIIINQKAGALVLPWEPADDGNGVWLFLQETFRTPHSKDPQITVSDILARKAYEELGVWSLEAPAGGLQYVDGKAQEDPAAAAAREATEETGLVFEPQDLQHLLSQSGLHISSDINTKVTYFFLADIRKGHYEEDKRAVEDDEFVNELMAFRVRNSADVLALAQHTRYHSDTTVALLAAGLQPEITAFFTPN